VLLQGDDRPGLAYAVAWAGLVVCDLEMDVVGTRYSTMLTFNSDADADKVVVVIRKVTRGGAGRIYRAR